MISQRIYRINFSDGFWNADEGRFRSLDGALSHVRKREGAEGEVKQISKDRVEVHYKK